MGAVLCRSPERDWDVNREIKGWGLGEWLVLLSYDGDSKDDLSDEWKWITYLKFMAPFVSSAMMGKSPYHRPHLFQDENWYRESGKTLQCLNERCPKRVPVGHRETGTRKPTGSALPSKMQDKAQKTSGKARNLEQHGKIFPITWRSWECS